MTRKQIQDRRKKLDQERKELQRKLDHLQLEYKHLRMDCKHPNATHGRDISGVSETRCPDCGYID